MGGFWDLRLTSTRKRLVETLFHLFSERNNR
jgi:hypothetical protein